MIQGSEDPKLRSLSDAKALIKRLAAEIRTKEDFAGIAKRYSEEAGTRERGGRIGFHPRRSPQVPEDFLARVFALEPGTVSEPFRVPEGWAIAMVTDVRPAPPESELRRMLRRALMKSQVRRWVEESEVELLLPGV